MTSEQKPEGQDRRTKVPRAKSGRGRGNIKFKSRKGRTCLAQKKKKKCLALMCQILSISKSAPLDIYDVWDNIRGHLVGLLGGN